MSDGEIYAESHDKAEYCNRSFIERFIFLLVVYSVIHSIAYIVPSIKLIDMWTTSNAYLGILCIATCTVIGIVRTITNRNMIQTIPQQMRISTLVMDGLCISVKYSILEELYYRWLMFSCLFSVISILDFYSLCYPLVMGLCIIVVSVCFAEVHLYQGTKGALSAFIFSFVLFFVSLKCGIIFAIMVHFFYNLSLFLTSAVLLYRFRNSLDKNLVM